MSDYLSPLQESNGDSLGAARMRPVINKLLVTVIAMLCPLTAFAAQYSYRIPDGWSSPMCRAVRDALAEGLVLDAQKPVCERRFELSPQAQRLGLQAIKKTLLPASDYPALMLQFIEVGKPSPSPEQKQKDEKQATHVLSVFNNYIYVSHFDADNSGRVRLVYISYIQLCNLDLQTPVQVQTYPQDSDGKLDPTWGGSNMTAGIPFIYDRRTYYLQWTSHEGGVYGDTVAQANVFDSAPYIHGTPGYSGAYNFLLGPLCKINQIEKGKQPWPSSITCCHRERSRSNGR
jgi:hypothetical protein